MTTALSTRDKKLLIYVGGIAVLLLVYFLVFQPSREKTEVIENENLALSQKVTELQILDAKKEEYKKQTEDMNKEIVEKLTHFPAAVLEEDTIMYAVDLEKLNDMVINNIGISQPELLYTSAIPTASPAFKGKAEEVGPSAPIFLNNTNAVYSFTCSYEGFKEILAVIQKDNKKKNVDTMALAYDQESGMLIGTMSVNMFAVDGTGVAYSEPSIPDVKLGVENVFGTAEPIKKD